MGAAKQFCSKMVRNRQSKTLLHFVERLIFSQWILNLVVTGFEPTTIRFADGSINRHAIRPVGPRQKPFSRTSKEDPKIAKRTSLNRQFLGQVAGGRVGSGRVGPGRVADCVFFTKIKLQSRFAAIKGPFPLDVVFLVPHFIAAERL